MRKIKLQQFSTTTATISISQGTYLQLYSSQMPIRCFEIPEFTTQSLLLSLNSLQHLSYFTETASQKHAKRFVRLGECFDSKRLMSLTSFVDVWQPLISLGLSLFPSSPENFADCLLRSPPQQNSFLGSTKGNHGVECVERVRLQIRGMSCVYEEGDPVRAAALQRLLGEKGWLCFDICTPHINYQPSTFGIGQANSLYHSPH